MDRKVVYRADYKNGDGFAVSVGKAPDNAIKSDVICLHTARGENGTNQYYTPDEAFSVAIGLFSGVDAVLGMKFYDEFRKKPELVLTKPCGFGRTAMRKALKKQEEIEDSSLG